MRVKDEIIAVVCADIHLSAKPPRARKEEVDWFKAMRKPLIQMNELANHYNVPILCAGDVFHHWKADPALINFALQWLPKMYAIPGQHDLPLHNIDLIEKSSFWTLCLTGKITPVINKEPIMVNDIIVHGFPYGRKLTQVEKNIKGKYHVALVHDFLWIDDHGFPNAPKKQKALKIKDKVKGYQSVIYGDNHKGFLTKINNVTVFNCGSLMRRNSDQKEYMPQIGLLCKSGTILTQKINTSGEMLLTVEDDIGERAKETNLDMSDFMSGLREAMINSFDYVEAIEFLMERYTVAREVREVLLKALKRD